MSEKQSFDPSLLFIPEGVRDVFDRACRDRNTIGSMIRNEMKLYGFQEIQTPSFEFFDIFNKERGTVASNRMYKFFDRHNNTLVLRPDHTPQIARCVARYYAEEELQLRFSYTGSIFIRQDDYQGKLSETTQIGAEIIGDSSSDADGELLTLVIDCLNSCGLKEYTIDIGHAGIFRGLVREAGLNEEETLRLRTFIDNNNSHAVSGLLKDKDIPKGIREVLIHMPEIFVENDSLSFVKERVTDSETLSAVERLETIFRILDGFGMKEHVNLDLGMLSKMDYYTGVIFKAFTYGTGEAIVSGGRYDHLMEQFGKQAPAVGVVFLLDQLMEALESENVEVPAPEGDVLILYRSANRAKAIELAQTLRNEGQPVCLMRKCAEVSIETYKQYSKRRGLKEIRYIDDTGEITVFS